MKKKCILILVLTMGMFLLSSENAMAATGISDAEESILERLSEGIEMNGVIVKMPVSYLNQVENELMKNEVDITAEQAAIIRSKMDEAAEIVETMNMSELMDFNNSDSVKQLIRLVEETASIANYTVSFDFANASANIVDSDGNYVFVAKNTINQTGYDITETIIVGSVLVALLAACIILASKMNLFVKKVKYRYLV